jgi:hypothetical protein
MLDYRASGSALEVLALADHVEKHDPPSRAKNTRIDADFYLGALEEARRSVPISDLPQDASDEFKMFSCDAQYDHLQSLQVCIHASMCVCIIYIYIYIYIERERERERGTCALVYVLC